MAIDFVVAYECLRFLSPFDLCFEVVGSHTLNFRPQDFGLEKFGTQTWRDGGERGEHGSER